MCNSARPAKRSSRFAAGVPGRARFSPPFALDNKQTNNHERYLPAFSETIHANRISSKTLRHVKSTTFPAFAIAPQHRTLPKAAPALAPTSTTCAIDGKYGGSGEFDEDDGRSGAGHARVGRICWCNVSLQYLGIVCLGVRLLLIGVLIASEQVHGKFESPR
jgi:hypothetical protein